MHDIAGFKAVDSGYTLGSYVRIGNLSHALTVTICGIRDACYNVSLTNSATYTYIDLSITRNNFFISTKIYTINLHCKCDCMRQVYNSYRTSPFSERHALVNVNPPLSPPRGIYFGCYNTSVKAMRGETKRPVETPIKCPSVQGKLVAKCTGIFL